MSTAGDLLISVNTYLLSIVSTASELLISVNTYLLSIVSTARELLISVDTCLPLIAAGAAISRFPETPAPCRPADGEVT